MKLAMAQMRMTGSMDENLKTSLEMCDSARGCDLLFFPEVQLTPFFPQYEKRDVSGYILKPDSEPIRLLCNAAKKNGLYMSPNVYLEADGKRYDTSLWIDPCGELKGAAKMVHIAQAEQFYEQDYYTPSPDGFKVFDTPLGKVGIVICFDRHLPESIRTCALMGAQLVIIPTANTEAEPMELFEWEVRVQAMQNQVFVAMCNRVGLEDKMDFAGQSIVVHPSGDVIVKADNKQRLVTCDIDLAEVELWRGKRPYISTRRKDMYL